MSARPMKRWRTVASWIGAAMLLGPVFVMAVAIVGALLWTNETARFFAAILLYFGVAFALMNLREDEF